MTTIQTEAHLMHILSTCSNYGVQVTPSEDGFGYKFKLCDNTYQIGIDYSQEMLEIIGEYGTHYIPLYLLLCFGVSMEKNGYGLYFKFGSSIDFSGIINIH